MKNKKYRSIKGQLSAKLGFSFVELIIVIAVIALISVIGMSINNNYTEKTKNSKISSDIKTIQSSLESYKNETKTLPLPKGNQKYFDNSANYVHYDDPTKFGVYGNITEDTIPKKYMNYTPIDPRTNQYYAYGKTLNGDLAFEISGVNKDNNKFESVVIGDYVGENGPYNLIREYNGPDFVYDQSKNNFPYNPEERVIKAKLGSFSGTVKVNGFDIDKNWVDNNDLVSGDDIFVGTGGQVEIFYSDGSKSYLGDSDTTSMNKTSRLVLANMTYKGENNLFTKIQLALDYGSIWTKTSRLDSDSEFEIYTTDTEAAVRGTIFGVDKSTPMTFVKVQTGSVLINKIVEPNIDSIINKLKSSSTITTDSLAILPASNLTIAGNTATLSATGITYEIHMGTTIYTTPSPFPPTLPNEDGLENIKPKITSINSGKVTLEFPTSFSGTSNGKRVYTGSTALPYPSPHYIFSGNTLTLLSTIAGDVYTLKICDSQGIKCTQEISINKELAYNGTVGGCNPPYQVQFTGPEYTGCIDMDQSLVDDGYHLVAYAPYDVVGKYGLYAKTGAYEDIAYKDLSLSHYDDSTSEKGIFMSTGTSDHLYYTLNTTTWGTGSFPSNYAIEMSVRGSALNRPTGKYYLWRSLNDPMGLYINDPISLGKISFATGTTNSSTISTSSLSLIPNLYYPVIFKVNGTNYSVKVNGTEMLSGTTTLQLKGNIYIGSLNTLGQWNDIINYVKLYSY